MVAAQRERGSGERKSGPIVTPSTPPEAGGRGAAPTGRATGTGRPEHATHPTNATIGIRRLTHYSRSVDPSLRRQLTTRQPTRDVRRDQIDAPPSGDGRPRADGIAALQRQPVRRRSASGRIGVTVESDPRWPVFSACMRSYASPPRPRRHQPIGPSATLRTSSHRHSPVPSADDGRVCRNMGMDQPVRRRPDRDQSSTRIDSTSGRVEERGLAGSGAAAHHDRGVPEYRIVEHRHAIGRRKAPSSTSGSTNRRS